jgi:hypothetical protein
MNLCLGLLKQISEHVSLIMSQYNIQSAVANRKYGSSREPNEVNE